MIQSFQQKLECFNLSPLEISILSALLQKSPLDSKYLQKILFNHKGKRNPYLYRTLSNLSKAGWIEVTDESPKKYSFVSKKKFDEKLNSIILITQELFQTQKKNYYQILETVEQISGSDKSETQMRIPDKLPDFLKQWLEIVFTKEKWSILKSEANMIIALRKEDISFKLNSVEFEIKKHGRSHFGGLICCEMESHDDQMQLLERIHRYNQDTIAFNYKMEKKGYVEEKKRNLETYTLSEPIFSQKEIYHTKFHLTGKNLDMDTFLESQRVINTDQWIISVWGESEIFFNQIMAYSQKFQF